MRALVTGGAGFLGSTLVDRLLAEGHAVDVIDDLSTGRLANLADARSDRAAELHIHQLDVRSPETAELVARRRPEVVFHLAARRHDEPAADAHATVVAALHVLEGARAAGARKVVVAVGAGIYGEPEAMPVRESQDQNPVDAHAVAEQAVLSYLHFYRERHRLDFTALVLAEIFGPRQRPGDGVVASMGRAVLDGEPVAVVARSRDFVYVDDAVDALVHAAEHGSGVTINVGRGVATSEDDLLSVLADAAGTKPRTVPCSSDGIERLALDPSRARIQLGWSSWTSLEEGVAATLRALAKEVLGGRPDDLGRH